MRHSILIFAIASLFFVGANSVFAQEADEFTWEDAQEEITNMFGFVPDYFNAIPDHLRAPMWNYMKASSSPDAAIPPKYAELIGLAVASQIPCSYCIYYHTEQLKAYGATEEEIKEAVAAAAGVRLFSTIVNGNQTDMEEFQKQVTAMLEYASQASSGQ